MTTDDRNQDLIEQAAKAINEVSQLANIPWDLLAKRSKEFRREQARAALAVFEAAQKPSEDEREHMAQVIRNAEASGPVFASTLADVILAAGFRRPVHPPTNREIRRQP